MRRELADRSTPGQRHWWWREWPTDWVVALLLAVATTLMLLPYRDLHLPTVRGNQAVGGDEMGHLATALRVRRGDVLYRDVFSFKGPLGLVPFVAAYVVAPATVKTGRVALMVVVGLWTGIMYLLGRTLTGRRTFALPFALVVPLVIWPAWPFAYPDFVAQIFVASAVLAAAKANAGWTWGWQVAGACAAAALWVHIGQGGPLFVALLAGVGLTLIAFGRVRAAVQACRGLLIGFAFGVAVVVLWMAAHGVAAEALRSIFIFPTRGYGASPYNHIAYGMDAGSYPGRWLRHGTLARDIVKTIVDVDVQLPRFGVIAAALIVMATSGLALVSRRRKRDGVCGGAEVPPVPAIAAAAAAAVCLPAVLNTIRTDLCHLGFVAGGGLIAGAGLVALARSQDGRLHRLAMVATTLGSVALATLVLASGGIYAFAATRPYSRQDIDQYGRALLDTDLAAARTKPGDAIYMATFDGWHYLYTGRENPTPFFWLYDDPISAQHWPIAAEHIRRKKPRLLLMPARYFDLLVQHQPDLRSLYFGYGGNYMLDERRPGPPLAVDRSWVLTAGVGGSPTSSRGFGLRFTSAQRSARLDVAISENDGKRAVLGSIDGDTVCIFDGPLTYVGTVAPDGQRIEGQRYQHNQAPVPFSAFVTQS